MSWINLYASVKNRTKSKRFTKEEIFNDSKMQALEQSIETPISS